MEKFTVLDLLDLELKEQNDLNLTCIGGRPGLEREIIVPDINRPGLALSGFFDSFGGQRIQLFGRGEYAYLQKLDAENNYETIREFFTHTIPCCIFSNSLQPSDIFIKMAAEADCPVLQSSLNSSEFAIRLIRTLGNIFAPTRTIHGVLVEVFGIGVLITGNSGVGKSETALELIERGHRLITDESVELKFVSGSIVLGSSANKVAGHHMEIRGLGIINISHLFGVGAIRDQKQVQLIIDLEEWDSTKIYDRLGTGDNTTEILGVKIPTVTVPVKPGRNIPILIETAAMNERLKKMGYFSAREFNQNILKWLESENARSLYFQQKDIF